MMDVGATIAAFGEKALIRDLIKPLFNPDDDPGGVGDDCAMVPMGSEVILLSTDRVPADLIALKLGFLDHAGMGDYLARLNLSDIAACGGRAIGLLLNLGVPDTLPYNDFCALCRGVQMRASECGCRVLGGDITAASELSLSATAVGVATAGSVLTRRGARPGDTVFLTRPIGLTPAAFLHFLAGPSGGLTPVEEAVLKQQFTAMLPMLELGQRLARSGACSACMDNTDGVGQTLTELGEASGVGIEIDELYVVVPELVGKIAAMRGIEPREFIFNGGADFSLVGTLRGHWSQEATDEKFGSEVHVMGRVIDGAGLWLRTGTHSVPLKFTGWNYFSPAGPQVPPK